MQRVFMFIYTELPRENVFGHTKKITLIREKMLELSKDLGRGLRVLDVGCGNGRAVTRYLAHEGGHVLGIDFHKPSIDYARNQFGAKGIEFQVRQVEDLSINGNKFDVIVLADVLEHVNDPGRLLLKMLHLVDDDGRIYVTIPNGFGPFELESFISRMPWIGVILIRMMDYFIAFLNKFVFKGTWSKVVVGKNIPYNEESLHIHFFSRTGFVRLIRDYGLEVRDQRNLSWLSGSFSNYLFAPSQRFCRWNSTLADKLPYWMVSAWFFELAADSKGSPKRPSKHRGRE